MKKVSIFALLAIGGLTVGLTSCSKEDPATALEVNTNQTATINGKLLINTDEADSIQNWSAAPAGVQIIATVPYSQLNSGASGTYQIKDVNYNPATGEFAINAPVSANGSAITVKFADFKGQVIVPTMGDTAMTTKTLNVIWKSQSKTSSNLLPGEVYNLPTWELSGAGNYVEDVNAGDEI